MESNVIDFASRLKARDDARGISQAAQIDHLDLAVGNYVAEINVLAEKFSSYLIRNIGLADETTYELVLVAQQKVNKARGLLMNTRWTLDEAAMNECHRGDPDYEYDLPEFHDLPA